MVFKSALNMSLMELVKSLKEKLAFITASLNNLTISSIKKKWLLIVTPLIYAIISLTPISEKYAFLPDWINLSKVDPKEYFGLIIGAIASIFGIVMAVVLITVEFFKERLNNNTFYNPLDKQIIRNSIYSSISLIALSFIAYVNIESFNSSANLTIGYFLGLIFLFYIYSVYPVLKNIIGESSRIKGNIELVSKINLNSYKTVSRYRYQNPEQSNDYLIILKKEIDDYILKNDVSAYEKINEDILSTSLSFIAEGQDRENCDIIVSGLVWLWEENCKTAIRANDSNFFDLLWNYIRDLYVHFAKEKAPLLHLQDLNLFISVTFFKLHIKLGNSMPLITALNCVEISFKANLKNNCPKQEDLKELVRMYEGGEFIETGFYDSTQWDAINSIISLFYKIQQTAISLSDKNVFEDSIRWHQGICSDLYNKNFDIGNYQKGYIFRLQLTSSFYSSSLALESGLYPNTRDCFRIPRFLFDRIIEKNEVDEKDMRAVMSQLADYLIVAFKNKKLTMDVYFGTLNDYCRTGIVLLKHYHTNKIAKKTVKFTIKFLCHLKTIAEEDLAAVNPNDYLAIKNKIKHFIDVAIDYDGFNENEKSVKKWREIYDNFKEVSEIRDFGIIKW
jgi:heme/copper-type cytochrome/quinol oxidase subunit 2